MEVIGGLNYLRVNRVSIESDPIGSHWFPLVPIGSHWFPLVPIGSHWFLKMKFRIQAIIKFTKRQINNIPR